MSQLIYAFSAVVIAAVLSFQFFVGARKTQLHVHRNEVLSQVGGLAAEIRRLVDGEFRFAVDRVRIFGLTMLDADALRTPALKDTRQIDVNLSVPVPTTQADEQLEEVRWKSVVRPANLSRN